MNLVVSKENKALVINKFSGALNSMIQDEKEKVKFKNIVLS